VSKLTDTTPGSGPKIMLDYINYRIINDRKNKKGYKMKIELNKKEKDYLESFLVQGHLDDLNKDFRRHQDDPLVSKEIKDEIRILKSVINKLKL